MPRKPRPETDLTPFGRWLIEQLDARGMSRADLARAAGVRASTITGWLYGAPPSMHSCMAIRRALPAMSMAPLLEAAGHVPAGAIQILEDGLRVSFDTMVEWEEGQRLLRVEAHSLIEMMPDDLLSIVVPMLRAGAIESERRPDPAGPASIDEPDDGLAEDSDE